MQVPHARKHLVSSQNAEHVQEVISEFGMRLARYHAQDTNSSQQQNWTAGSHHGTEIQ